MICLIVEISYQYLLNICKKPQIGPKHMNLPILLAVRSCSHKCMYWYTYYIYECLRDKNSIPVSQFLSLFWSKIVFSNSVNHQNISFIIILNRTDIYVLYIVFLKKKTALANSFISLIFFQHFNKLVQSFLQQ